MSKENNLLESLESTLKKYIDEKRYKHTKGVEMTAACMAMKFGYQDGLRGNELTNYILRARIAGLLHDNAKCISDDKMLRVCDENGIDISDFERQHVFLLHGKVGAYYLSKRYGIEDEEIASAIAFHTTGKPNMTTLEKIIFIADYIEPGRTKQRNLDLVRFLALTDLDTCVYKISEDTLIYLKEKEYPIDDMTAQTAAYYEKLSNKELLKG